MELLQSCTKLVIGPYEMWLWFQICKFYFKHNLGIDILSIQVNINLEQMPDDLTDGQSTLVQILAWCR